MKKTLFITLSVLLLTSCGGSRSLKPESSGAAFELLLVIDDDVYNSPAGDSLRMFIEGPVPFLPQPEPQFQISRIPHRLYDRLLQTTRNILFVNIDPNLYTQAKAKFLNEPWANNQAVCNINAPSRQEFADFISKNGDRIVDFFVTAERKRMHEYFLANFNRQANDTVYELFDSNLAIPTSFNRYKRGDHFLWISNGSASGGQNIVMYSVRYTSTEQLTHESILARRDSVMKANIPGELQGSYMGTELKYLYPETRFITHNGEWAAVTRGLWRMRNGALMGGPFVSLTRIDRVNKRILTVEGFVFAPSRAKRNLLRQMDAMVYSLLTPQDLYKRRIEREKQGNK
ncbi:MAG: DUF4837 family protein [Paludibacteraceae bacterium]|nr:DUF4837 family protein [Paludibacteraceae bacterium]